MLCTVNAANQDASARGVPLLPRRPRRPLHPVHPDRRARQRHRLPGGRHRHRPLGRPGAWGRFLDRGLRRVGRAATSAPCSCRCSTPRSPPGSGLPAVAVHLRRDLRQRRRARAQRRPLLVRPLRRTRVPARQHHRRPTWSSCSRRRQQRAFGDAKRDTLPALLPRVRGAVRLPRRVPEEPLHPHARRRTRPQLSLRRLQGVLHPHRRARCASWPTCSAGAATPTRSWASSRSAGRNDPCPCGSGRKAKHCHVVRTA